MKVYSFDIFDTCIVRACGSPKNIFEILASKVCYKPLSKTERLEFVLERIDAEKRARDKKESGEVTLEQIYEEAKFEALTDCSKEEIKKLEINLEIDLSSGVKEIREKVDSLRKKGLIIFISDMYLPREVIEKILIKNDFLREKDYLFISHETGFSKNNGSLYRYVQEQLKISKFNWIHFGDNRYADIRQARRFGIKAKKIIHKYSFYENLLIESAIDIDSYKAQCLASISKAIRLQLSSNPKTLFGADFVAPIFSLFTLSILEDAKRNNIKKLYFLSRDCLIPYNIACEFIKANPEYKNIECHYLYLSRSSIYFPCLSEISVESLGTLNFDPTLPLSYSLPRLKNFIPDSDFDELNNLIKNKKGKELEETVIKFLSKLWMKERNVLLQYFIQEGLAEDNGSSAIVDIQGSRTCQVRINSLLEEYGYAKVRGYYFTISEPRNKPTFKNEYKTEIIQNFLNQYTQYKDSRALGFLLEQYFAVSEQGRTIGYQYENGIVVPEFDPNSIVPEYTDIFSFHNSVSLDFLSYFNKCNLLPEINTLFQLNLKILFEFASKPERNYLKALYKFPIIEFDSGTKYLVDKIGFFNLIKRHNIWFRGSLYYTFRFSFIVNFGLEILDFARRGRNYLKRRIQP